MCTLTWQSSPGGYELHFNRDESRSRSKAEPPKIHTHANSQVQAIFPLDTDAGGTWISVNQSGLSLCLLNNYQHANRYQGTVSRGMLIRELSQQTSLQLLRDELANLDVSIYSPFDVFALSPNEGSARYSWDGDVFVEKNTPLSFLSSSGSDTEAVIQLRKAQFSSADRKDLAEFHQSHVPERSAYSVCMHRPDARTQSYSKIRVTSVCCEFWYTDGPPCSSELLEPIRITRKELRL